MPILWIIHFMEIGLVMDPYLFLEINTVQYHYMQTKVLLINIRRLEYSSFLTMM